jgi:hypothetical protein
VYNDSLLTDDGHGELPDTSSTSDGGGGSGGSSFTSAANTVTAGNATITTTGSSSSTTSGSTTQAAGSGSTTTAGSTDSTDSTDSTSSSSSAGGADDGSTGAIGTDTDSGTGGTSTTGSATTSVVPPDPELIDDLEDENSGLKRPLYTGYWYTAVNEDGTGSGVLPEPGEDCPPEELSTPRGESAWAMHISGDWTGDTWAAAVGFNFLSGNNPVEGSAFAGVTFWARSDDPSPIVKVQFITEAVTDQGHFEIELSELDDTWKQFQISWDDPYQPEWADPVGFDEDGLTKIQFQLTSGAIDLWVDDVRFYY